MTSIPISDLLQSTTTPSWDLEEAAAHYGIPDWGQGYFTVNQAGHVEIRPTQDPKRALDLYDLVLGLEERGVQTPLLLRFTDVLTHRIQELHDAFESAIQDEEFKGSYKCVYPIKVNQQRAVVEAVAEICGKLGYGLEAGSKAELLAVLGMTVDYPDLPIVCNGFKDEEYIETVILATKLGRKIIPVVEKFSDIELIVKLAKRYNVRPSIGIRVKLSTRGAGRWEASSGARSKFGLFISEILQAIELLKRNDMADCLNLLHFHIGSQISDIRSVKNAITELAHIYTELHRLGAGMTIIDIGGGLGVDYDGTKSASDSSVNYTIQEYAADVVYRIKAVCDEAGVPHPTILSESGRAMVAYGSVLVFDVVDASRFDETGEPEEMAKLLDEEEGEVPQPLLDLLEAAREFENLNLVEVYHDAMQAREEVTSLFSLGYVNLPVRAIAERLFWHLGFRILDAASKLDELPEELEALPELLSDLYFCNMSIFQSLPDSWAIGQLFPICPIHRLQERPTRRAVLADLTCDSDGKIDQFAHRRGPKKELDVHDLRKNERYFLAAFLVGAYQETLSTHHNLFGDTNAVHISLPEDGQPAIDQVIPGDTVSEVLSYVQINAKELSRGMRREVERAVRGGRLSPAESGALMRFYDQGLEGYTYLEY